MFLETTGLSVSPQGGKVTEKIILEVTGGHLKDNEAIGHSQHNFTRAKSSIINLICFPNKSIKGSQ